MSESFRTRLMRWGFNFFPAYRRTGGRITFIRKDWQEVHVKLPLNWKTRNYVGTMFGGSMFAVVDPIYMVMFIKLLGPEYIVWDKAAAIRFKRPGRTTLRACLKLPQGEIDAIRAHLEKNEKLERRYLITLVDAQGEVCAEVEKTLYFRKKEKPASSRQID